MSAVTAKLLVLPQHDGAFGKLSQVIEHYNKGGTHRTRIRIR